MGWFSPDMQTMKDLFLHSMQDIYYAEHQIEKALPQMVEKASDTGAQERVPDAPQADQEARSSGSIRRSRN